MRQLRRLSLGPGMRLLIAVSFSIAAISHADEAQRKPRPQPLVPLPREVSAPPDNPTTPDKVALGQQLFFDPRLSGDKTALSAEAKQGLELFTGNAGCVRCHRGPLLSDGKFYRLGISSKDEGLAAVTGQPADLGKFRTPSLRNIAETGPYMHDGSKQTLSAVVEFYYRGVPSRPVDGRPLDVQPLLGQSYAEIAAVVAFLESLTGEAPLVEPPELP